MTDISTDPETPEKASEMETAPEPKTKKLRTALILLLLFLAGLGGGAVAYLGPDRIMALISGPSPDSVPTPEVAASATAEAPDTGERKTLLMEDHIVNLVSGDGPSTRFVRVRTALIYNPAALPEEALETLKPQLRDAFHGFLSQLTERDLQGSYGLAMIREELLRRSRATVGSDAVREILITDLVIQ